MTFQHDLFVIHAGADEPFVHGHLLPAVGLASERVMRSSELALGAIKVLELEHAIQSSRLTVVVLSPAFSADRLAELAELLAGHADGTAGQLVPLLRADCELPLRLDARVSLDFRDPARWAEQAEKLRARIQQPEPAPVHVPCPYPGLRPFTTDAAARFYGRDAELDELIGRLRAGERELYVIGPSGSGKSSLVAAGLLPRLRRGVSELKPFLDRSMRPGEHPTARLAGALETPEADLAAPASAALGLLARRAPEGTLLLVIDQLEELFTVASAGERVRFMTALRALRGEARCVLVLTLRADFYGAFMESPLWKELRGRLSRIEVGPLDGDDLRAAITRPARDVGVYFEPELIERLLADAASEPGILPLLQETLVQLWDHRQLQLLTLADYQALGDGGRSGLAVALARRADATLRALTPAQQGIARRILLRLISFGEGRSNTRRQQPRSKLHAAGEDAADFELVLRRLIDDRLLTADDDGDGGEARIDLAHEAMIAAWPTLLGWIQTHRADEQRRRQLEAAAARWVARQRGAGGLLDPIELADAEAWQRTESARDVGQSADVAALIAASRAAHDRQQRRRRGLVGGAFATLAVFAMVVAMLAVAARRRAGEAEASRERAETERLQAEASNRKNQRLLAQSYQEAGRQLLRDGHPKEAIPYLVAARQKGQRGEALRMLFWEAIRTLPLSRLWHADAVNAASFSPDGTRAVTASDDNTARIWDAVTGKPLTAPLHHQGGVHGAAFSPDGARVVTASADNTARIWDATTGKPLTAPLQHQGVVRSAAFSPDGTRVVTASADRTARVWDAATGKPLTVPLEHQGDVNSAAFSPDGTRVVTASFDTTARIWNATTGKPLTAPLEHGWVHNAVFSAVFSPDGTRIVTASKVTAAQVWDATTGKPLTDLTAPGQWEHVNSAVFSPDGTRIVTASIDGNARVWDTATGKLLTTLVEHVNSVRSAAFSPDGTRVITASEDNTACIWDAATGKPLDTPLQHRAPVTSAAFSADGSRIVTVSTDDTARVWDAATGKPRTPPVEHPFSVQSAAFSPDGTRVVTASADTARIWDATTGKRLTAPLQHQNIVRSAAFSPDGTRVVTASRDHTARVWDAATGKPLTPPLQHEDSVWSAAFSPDGTRVVTTSEDKTARIWDAATGKPLIAPLQHEDVRSAAFSPDGTRVVTAGRDGTARIWEAATGRPVTAPLEHQGPLRSAAFSPDGTHLVTAGWDGTARVWDAATGRPVTVPLEHQRGVLDAGFSPDCTRVVTASDDKTVRIWDAATGKPLAAPLEHQGAVLRASFSPDGTRVVTASDGRDNAAHIWEIRLDGRTLDEWSALAARGPFVLSGSVHVLRTPLAQLTEAR